MKEMFLKFMIIVFSVNFSVGYSEMVVEEKDTVTVNGQLVQGASSSRTTGTSDGPSKRQKPLAPLKRTNGAIGRQQKRGPMMGIMSPEDRQGEKDPSEEPSNGGFGCKPTTDEVSTQDDGLCVAQPEPPCVETDESVPIQCFKRFYSSNQRMECSSVTHWDECPPGWFRDYESCEAKE